MPRFQLEVRDASSVRVTSQMLVLAACLSAAWLYSAEVKAQQKSGADRFAVDLVTLKSGDRLRGALLGASADGTVSMAVQREWLKRSRPRFYEEATRFETASASGKNRAGNPTRSLRFCASSSTMLKTH